MPEYLSPGVYIEEIEIGPKPIEGVSTSTIAFIGGAMKGPILEPTFVDSWSKFESTFGGLISNPRIYLGYAVDAFFRNGGKRAYIVRVASSTAAKSTFAIQNKENNGAILVSALEVGSEGDIISFTTANSSISGSIDVFKKKVNVTSINKRDLTVDDPKGFESGDRIFIKDITNNENATVKSIAGNVITLDGDLSKAYVTPTLRASDLVIGDKEIRMTDSSKFFIGGIVDITDGTNHEYRVVEGISGKKIIFAVGLSSKYSLDTADPKVSSMDFNLTLKKGSITESFTNLSIDPRHPRFFSRIVTSNIASVKLNDPPATAASPEKLLPKDYTNQGLSGGKDDDLSAIVPSKGLPPLEKYEGISLLAIPGATSQSVQQDMIDHCEKMRYRFAILDSEPKADIDEIKKQRESRNSRKGYAALYYPWLQIVDPVSQENIFLPPSGMVAGIYARSDGERGVHKAPANETVAGAIGLQKTVTKGEQEVLNPAGIDVIRYFPGRGIMVWGARTVASDPLWKYVNVRRLFIFLEESIERATQWVVFEPNNEKLWARVKATITPFLTNIWKDGALMGTKPEEAFFIKCDRTTMTQNDIDNGRLIVVIGVAAVKPAEFVIFRIAQWQGGSALTE